MIYFPRSSEPRKGDQLTPCAAAGGWTEIESRGQESEGGRCNTTLGARWNPAALQNGVAKQRRENRSNSPYFSNAAHAPRSELHAETTWHSCSLVYCFRRWLPALRQTYGEITGTVTDTTGASIDGALV